MSAFPLTLLPHILGSSSAILLTSSPSVLPLGLFTYMFSLLGVAAWSVLSFLSGLAQIFIFEAYCSVF